VLFDGANRNTFALRAFPQPRQEFEAFTLAPRKRIVSRHGVKDVEPGLADSSDAKCSIEDVAACLRKVDCAQDLRDRRHRYLLTDQRRRSFRARKRFRRADVTPSVHGGASLAGNESARMASISLCSASRSVGCSPWRCGMSWSCVTGERFTCGFLPRSELSNDRSSHLSGATSDPPPQSLTRFDDARC